MPWMILKVGTCVFYGNFFNTVGMYRLIDDVMVNEVNIYAWVILSKTLLQTFLKKNISFLDQNENYIIACAISRTGKILKFLREK